MNETYTLNVAGLKRDLPLCPIGNDVFIAAFIMFSDVELTVACAQELLKQVPEYDVIITAESKGIPLAYEMARQSGKNYYLARKSKKLYMKNAVEVDVKSITTANVQKLYLDSSDMEALKGKRVLIVAHGNSLRALVKYFDNFSDDEIINVNIPTGVPLVYEFDDEMKAVKHYYLMDEEQLRKEMEAVANQGKAK